MRRWAMVWGATTVIACGGAQTRADCIPSRLSLPVEVHVEGAHAIDAERIARSAWEARSVTDYTSPELTDLGAQLRTAIVDAYAQTPYASVTVSRAAIALDAARSHVDVSFTITEGDAHSFGGVSIDDATLASAAVALVPGAPFAYAQVENTRRAMLASCRDAGYPHCTVSASLSASGATSVDVTVHVERGSHATVDAIEVLDEIEGPQPVPRALEGVGLGAAFVGSNVDRARLALAALHPDRDIDVRVEPLEDPEHVVVRFLCRVRATE